MEMPPEAVERQALFPHKQVGSLACFQPVDHLCFLSTLQPFFNLLAGPPGWFLNPLYLGAFSRQDMTSFLGRSLHFEPDGRAGSVSGAECLKQDNVCNLPRSRWGQQCGLDEEDILSPPCPHSLPRPLLTSGSGPDGAHILRSTAILGSCSLLHLVFHGAE